MNNQLTRSGVAYNIEISPHKLELEYSDGEVIEYTFSSNRYKEIFLRKYKDNRDKINESLSNRFGVTYTNNKLCDIKLYSSTEKRGFLIRGKEEFKCLSTIRLDGQNLMNKN